MNYPNDLEAIRIAGANFDVKIRRDYEPLELYDLTVIMPERTATLLVTYQEMAKYRDDYDKDMEQSPS